MCVESFGVNGLDVGILNLYCVRIQALKDARQRSSRHSKYESLSSVLKMTSARKSLSTMYLFSPVLRQPEEHLPG